MHDDQKGIAHIGLIVLIVLVSVAVGFVGWRVFSKRERGNPISDLFSSASDAEKAGQELSNGNCEGTGAGTLSQSAMNFSDFEYMIPYGLMVGGHVTPIDHQYYSVDRSSPRDAYPVYAMGDAKIVGIEHRTSSPGDNDYVSTHKTDEYRLVFSQSCTFFYYYDLVTSLDPSIQAEFDAAGGGSNVKVNIPVKAGDTIGRIGGQTLDFAVWNTEKKLPGFVVPDHYKGEPWKVYVADPLDYYTPDLKAAMLERYPRTDEPLSGKIDWDIDGTLRGNWFVKGTDIRGDQNNQQAPWSTHLAFAGDLYEPSKMIVSIGDYGPGSLPGVDAQQYYIKGNLPNPADVTPDTGLVKYELVVGSYVTPEGKPWDLQSFVKGLKVQESSQVQGVALVQMTDGRTLKFEAFPGKTASQVSGFDDNAKIYTR